MTYLKVENISKSYDKQSILKDVSFEVKEGSITSVLGSSGGGKSTLLRIIAGFERIDYGQIFKDGKVIGSRQGQVPPAKRNIGLVFQDFALFPHMTVDQNIRFGYKSSGKYNIDQLYDLTGLKGFEKRFPHELSGGEQQRVALARSMAASPDVLLLDEPFSNIDVAKRREVRQELKSMLGTAGITSIIVTHDHSDAMVLSDQIVVLNKGKIMQVGDPETIYRRPNSLFVANFFGPCNELTVVKNGDALDSVFGKISGEQLNLLGDKLLVRPDELFLHKDGTMHGIVNSIAEMGAYNQLTVEKDGQTLLINSTESIEKGQEIRFSIRH